MSSNKWVTAYTLITGVVTIFVVMLIVNFTITKKQQVINWIEELERLKLYFLIRHTSIIYKRFFLFFYSSLLLFKYLLKYEWICKVLHNSLVQHLQQLVEDVLSEDICTLRALALWHGGQERTFSPWETGCCWFSQSKQMETKFKSVILPSVSGHSFYVKCFSG